MPEPNAKRWLDLILPLGIIGCLLVILVPLPPAILDVLLAANITVAVIVLLTTIQIKTPMEFGIFPTLLLATALSRVILNIATTRLILSKGATENGMAAGGVIQSFGEFVAGNQITVGIVIFAIIVVVQFVVITKGATRISEVAARFTLDGLPGRQMAIDADLNAGVIDSKQASQRREDLQEQADFYGAMDGASKFVRGDAIAGLIITVINIVGGLAVGLMAGMSIPQAAEVFTKLTIGDGLASQLPGLFDIVGCRYPDHSLIEIDQPAKRVRFAIVLAANGSVDRRRIFTCLDFHSASRLSFADRWRILHCHRFVDAEAGRVGNDCTKRSFKRANRKETRTANQSPLIARSHRG